MHETLNTLTHVKAPSPALPVVCARMKWFWMAFCSVAPLFCADSSLAQQEEAYEQAPINYSSARPQDAVARLQDRIAAGKVKLDPNDRQLVQTMLRELGIPVESQLLVYSKTSLQAQRISPDHPRALYFTDTCYVGWVPSGLVELTAIDPVLGPIFYSLDPAGARTNAERCLTRSSDCLRCHGGTFIRGIPGVLARSVFTDATGDPLLRHGSEMVDFRTPFTNRWGGWYVTGTHGRSLHRGNVLAREIDNNLVIDFRDGANITNLSRFFDPGSYLVDTSDIVALLVFEQQLTVQNSLTRASLICRRMLDYQKTLQRELKDPFTEEPAYESVKSVFDHTAREVVDDLLFKDEAELPKDIKGSPDFERGFLANALRTTEGNSLKDFDLHSHLFRNRCSYLVYSPMFKALPSALKKRVFQRLIHALSPVAPDPRYAYLGEEERARIRAILRETDSELRSVFSSGLGAAASIRHAEL